MLCSNVKYGCLVEPRISWTISFGFALVPISSVLGKGKVTQVFGLSSTDLFHSPAGTIKLSLSLTANTPLNPMSVPFADSVADSSTISELLVDKKISEDY